MRAESIEPTSSSILLYRRTGLDLGSIEVKRYMLCKQLKETSIQVSLTMEHCNKISGNVKI